MKCHNISWKKKVVAVFVVVAHKKEKNVNATMKRGVLAICVFVPASIVIVVYTFRWNYAELAAWCVLLCASWLQLLQQWCTWIACKLYENASTMLAAKVVPVSQNLPATWWIRFPTWIRFLLLIQMKVYYSMMDFFIISWFFFVPQYLIHAWFCCCFVVVLCA